MADDEDVQRGLAICTSCDAVHSVRIWPDGSIRPIGTGYGTDCTCGGSDFRIVDDIDGTDVDGAE